MCTDKVLILMLALELKHYLADFTPLQNVYMVVGKGKSGWEWIIPLAAHSLIHALFTGLIFGLTCGLPWMGAIDFIIHFIIDRIKATYKLTPGIWTGPQRAENLSKYYTALGLDQLAHHLTYIGLIFLVLKLS